jgi:class 3 adenylate cyclase
VFLPALGSRIRARREKQGLKQQDVANALGVSPQAVSKWERGENAPDIASVTPLARLLGVTVEWILEGGAGARDVFEATVLVSGVNGAYRKSLDMEPRDFAAWANGMFHTLTETTLRYGGVPVKYMGDGYLAFFSGAAHREQALNTALRSRKILSEDVRIGLHAGDIYLGAVGHPDYARPDIMGEVVNIAFLVLEWAQDREHAGVAATGAALEGTGRDLDQGEDMVFKGIDHPVRVCLIGADDGNVV